jgi:hypothetical protein
LAKVGKFCNKTHFLHWKKHKKNSKFFWKKGSENSKNLPPNKKKKKKPLWERKDI